LKSILNTLSKVFPHHCLFDLCSRLNALSQWLKWYALAEELSEARSKGPKPKAQRANSGVGSRGPHSWVGTAIPLSISYGYGITISSPAGSEAETQKKLVLVYFGVSMINFCPQHTIHLSFWPPTSVILYSRLIRQFLTRSGSNLAQTRAGAA